jgi:hypothetical protein
VKQIEIATDLGKFRKNGKNWENSRKFGKFSENLGILGTFPNFSEKYDNLQAELLSDSGLLKARAASGRRRCTGWVRRTRAH